MNQNEKWAESHDLRWVLNDEYCPEENQYIRDEVSYPFTPNLEAAEQELQRQLAIGAGFDATDIVNAAIGVFG